MGRHPNSGNPSFRFSPLEVSQMEAILKKHEGQVPPRDLLAALAQRFSNSPDRAGKTVVQMKQIWNWFQNRRYALRAKLVESPGKSSTSPVTRENATPARTVPSAPQPMSVASVGPHVVRNTSESSIMEFEAKSARDGAWYDVQLFISQRYMETSNPEVLVRFAGFGPEDDEWVNVLKHVRQRSLPCEASECIVVLPGDLILCFQEGKEQALYFDAHVLDAQRRRHDVRGCRCRFLVRYDHDQSEEIVPLRKICRRPETDYRLQYLHAADAAAAAASSTSTSTSMTVEPPANPNPSTAPITVSPSPTAGGPSFQPVSPSQASSSSPPNFAAAASTSMSVDPPANPNPSAAPITVSPLPTARPSFRPPAPSQASISSSPAFVQALPPIASLAPSSPPMRPPVPSPIGPPASTLVPVSVSFSAPASVSAPISTTVMAAETPTPVHEPKKAHSDDQIQITVPESKKIESDIPSLMTVPEQNKVVSNPAEIPVPEEKKVDSPAQIPVPELRKVEIDNQAHVLIPGPKEVESDNPAQIYVPDPKNVASANPVKISVPEANKVESVNPTPGLLPVLGISMLDVPPGFAPLPTQETNNIVTEPKKVESDEPAQIPVSVTDKVENDDPAQIPVPDPKIVESNNSALVPLRALGASNLDVPPGFTPIPTTEAHNIVTESDKVESGNPAQIPVVDKGKVESNVPAQIPIPDSEKVKIDNLASIHLPVLGPNKLDAPPGFVPILIPEANKIVPEPKKAERDDPVQIQVHDPKKAESDNVAQIPVPEQHKVESDDANTVPDPNKDETHIPVSVLEPEKAASDILSSTLEPSKAENLDVGNEVVLTAAGRTETTVPTEDVKE